MTAERRDRTIRIDGAWLTYTVAGERAHPPICFISGWCGRRSFFASQIDHFAKRNLVIAVDFPGFGDSRMGPGWSDEASAGGDLMSRSALLVRDILAREDIRNCCLVGHSAGGALALTVATENPGSAWGVVGIDSLTYPLFYPRQDESAIDPVIRSLEADFASATRAVAETWFLPGADPAFKRDIIETTVAADKRTATATLRAFLRWDMIQHLKRYEGVVGAIVAADFYDAPAASAVLGDRVLVQTLPGVGHFLMMEQPDPFNRALERFLTKHG